MEPTTLSASAIQAFEMCEARFRAEYIDYARSSSGPHASLGTACHEALEDFMTRYKETGVFPSVGSLVDLFVIAARRMILPDKMIDDGKGMMERFHAWAMENEKRFQDFITILEIEVKKGFPISVPRPDGTGNFTVNVNYIFDRLDKVDHPDGYEIDVVDYKSFGSPLPIDELRHKVQVRIYALAAQIGYPDAVRIWVTYHLLRFDPIGMSFTREDNKETWRYLKDVLWRILNSDGTVETVNGECRWCIRRASCQSLARAESHGAIESMDFDMAAATYLNIDSKVKALMNLRDELASVLTDQLNDQETTQATTKDGIEVKVTVKTRRSLMEQEKVATILGPERMAKYGHIGVTDIDNLIKDGEITTDEAAAIRPLMKVNYSSALVVKADSPFED